jgi:hypothetical protein
MCDVVISSIKIYVIGALVHRKSYIRRRSVEIQIAQCIDDEIIGRIDSKVAIFSTKCDVARSISHDIVTRRIQRERKVVLVRFEFQARVRVCRYDISIVTDGRPIRP